MISDIFFDKSNLKIYEDSFLAFYVSSLINDSSDCTIDYIVEQLETLYGSHSFSYGKIKKYIEKNYIETKNHFSLTQQQVTALEYVNELKTSLDIMEWMSDDIIHKNISNYISNHDVKSISGFKFIAGLLKNKNIISEETLLSKYYDFVINYTDYHIVVDKTVNSIDDSYDRLPINLIIENKVLMEILFANGINDVWELKQLSADSVTLLFFIDFDNIISSLSPLCDDFKLAYKEKIFGIFKSLKEKELDILDKRNGFTSNHKMTLEEVGAIYEVTRERCRQVEVKATNKIISASLSVKNILINLYLTLCTQDSRYISVDKLFSFVGNDLISRYILFLYEVSEIDIVYDADLKVLFNKTQTNLEEICDEALENFGEMIELVEYEELDAFQKAVINHSYKLFRSCIYIKKGLTEKDLVGRIIDETFPNGYRTGSLEDYEKLKEAFYSKYGDSEDLSSDRAIVGYIERLDYCLIDRGTYKNRAECVALPQELIDDIINYIVENSPTVFYNSIYEVFERKLKELKVNNYYYLKGLIDPYLPSDFLTKRNYISIGDEKISSTEAMINYMKSFSGIFTLEDIHNKFKGVKDYTIYNVLYKEFEKGLICLSTKRFIYASQVDIEEEAVQELKEVIEGLFTSLNTRVTSSRKVYAKLSLTNKELLAKLKVATDSFSTFSLIKYLFKDDYGFNRPLIALDKDSNVDSVGLIINYVSTLDSFSNNTIKMYTAKMNIRGLYSYLEFMEEQSDDFVQVNQDTMVSKSKINISISNLQEIEKMLSLIFSRFEEIDADKFNGYAMLPKLSYRWNKYLLVGIIRSYFNDKYEIENTSTFYDKTSFIIRRAK